jgi:hypothetical protein
MPEISEDYLLEQGGELSIGDSYRDRTISFSVTIADAEKERENCARHCLPVVA